MGRWWLCRCRSTSTRGPEGEFASVQRKKPPCGGSSGGADRSRTDAYGICSPGPYHLATAPCEGAVKLSNIRAACAARAMERVMGFEPTTSTLARLHSTTELHPRETSRLAMARCPVNGHFHGPPPVVRPSGLLSAGGPPLLLRPHGPPPVVRPSGLLSAGGPPLLLRPRRGTRRRGRRA